mmetsp:Transcript_19543/g.64901  ORF Transcript_19543/g.64901 Transcript_19543/m.64901 type:complete len:111 (+) Transcript_19543:770-1102(+)
MDAFVFAQEAMNGLAMGPQRANAESYLELVGAGFRAGSSEECLAIVKEFIQIAPRARRPTIDFFNFCLRGFRVLKDSCTLSAPVLAPDQLPPSFLPCCLRPAGGGGEPGG